MTDRNWPPGVINCYFRARKVAHRYFRGRPDPLDDAGSAAIAGLLTAMRGTNRPDGSVPQAYLDRCVHSACFAANLKRKRRAGLLRGWPLEDRQANLADHKAMPPDWWAQLNEES